MIASIGISSANRFDISDMPATLPSMRSTILGWFRPIVLGRVISRIEEGEVKQTVKELRCLGTIQPFGARDLKLKKEGERNWNWQMLHTTPEVSLQDGEEFRIRGVPFRVMGQRNFSEYGYITYELVQDYVSAS